MIDSVVWNGLSPFRGNFNSAYNVFECYLIIFHNLIIVYVFN